MLSLLGWRKCSRRTLTRSRNYPTALLQQEPNGTMPLTEGTPNVMQRLGRLPTAPHACCERLSEVHDSSPYLKKNSAFMRIPGALTRDVSQVREETMTFLQSSAVFAKFDCRSMPIFKQKHASNDEGTDQERRRY
jgi:hypothetical protein